MSLLCVTVKKAHYVGNAGQFNTYVTLKLQNVKSTTITVKGVTPCWEQDFLFETNRLDMGLIVEVWNKGMLWDKFLGCHWLPLTSVQYSNEDGEGQWLSLDAELVMKDGVVVGTRNATGHSILVDARFELPYDLQDAEAAELQRKLEVLNTLMDQEVSWRQIMNLKEQSKRGLYSAHSEDSDYTSDVNYPVGQHTNAQHPNSSASQFRNTTASSFLGARGSYEDRQDSYENDEAYDDRQNSYEQDDCYNEGRRSDSESEPLYYNSRPHPKERHSPTESRPGSANVSRQSTQEFSDEDNYNLDYSSDRDRYMASKWQSSARSGGRRPSLERQSGFDHEHDHPDMYDDGSPLHYNSRYQDTYRNQASTYDDEYRDDHYRDSSDQYRDSSDQYRDSSDRYNYDSNRYQEGEDRYWEDDRYRNRDRYDETRSTYEVGGEQSYHDDQDRNYRSERRSSRGEYYDQERFNEDKSRYDEQGTYRSEKESYRYDQHDTFRNEKESYHDHEDAYRDEPRYREDQEVYQDKSRYKEEQETYPDKLSRYKGESNKYQDRYQDDRYQDERYQDERYQDRDQYREDYRHRSADKYQAEENVYDEGRYNEDRYNEDRYNDRYKEDSKYNDQYQDNKNWRSNNKKYNENEESYQQETNRYQNQETWYRDSNQYAEADRYPPTATNKADRYPPTPSIRVDRYPSASANKEDKYPPSANNVDRYPPTSVNKVDRYPVTAGNKVDRYPSPAKVDRYPTTISNKVDGYPSETSKVDRYPSETSKVDRYPSESIKVDRYPSEKHKRDRYPSSGNKADRYPSVTPKEDRYPPVVNKTDRYPSVTNKMDRYPLETKTADRYPSAINKVDRYPSETNRYQQTAQTAYTYPEDQYDNNKAKSKRDIYDEWGNQEPKSRRGSYDYSAAETRDHHYDYHKATPTTTISTTVTTTTATPTISTTTTTTITTSSTGGYGYEKDLWPMEKEHPKVPSKLNHKDVEEREQARTYQDEEWQSRTDPYEELRDTSKAKKLSRKSSTESYPETNDYNRYDFEEDEDGSLPPVAPRDAFRDRDSKSDDLKDSFETSDYKDSFDTEYKDSFDTGTEYKDSFETEDTLSKEKDTETETSKDKTDSEPRPEMPDITEVKSDSEAKPKPTPRERWISAFNKICAQLNVSCQPNSLLALSILIVSFILP